MLHTLHSPKRMQVPEKMATTQSKPDVFICHAGEQKSEIVDLMDKHLTLIHGLSVFVDEHSLQVAAHARVQMAQALDAATVANCSSQHRADLSAFLQSLLKELT